MATNLPSVSPLGVSPLGVSPLGATAPPTADAPAAMRALVRIEPTPRSAPVGPSDDASGGTPLDRSGLNLLDLLDATDVLVERTDTAPVALEVGLERARGALLRNLPGDALAALDHVWEGARRTEEGWYLRSGALTVLGLPAESERVSEEGLAVRPTSTALRFLQSLARVALGDLAGARNTLHSAQLRDPSDTLLLVQQAIVQAKQGDGAGAEHLLQRAAQASPEHPANEYGRAGIRLAASDATRQRSRPTPIDTPTVRSEFEVQRNPWRAAEVLEAIERESTGDVTADALFRLGARIALLPPAETVRESRSLLRALSAGGTLATVGGAEQTHAARILLTAFVGVISDGATDTSGPLRALVQQILPMLCDGRRDDAARLVRRSQGVGREPVGRLLQRVVDGAMAAEQHVTGIPSTVQRGTPAVGTAVVARITPLHSAFAGSAPEVGEPGGAALAHDNDAQLTALDSRIGNRLTPSGSTEAAVVRGELERSPIIPVRLGLALLDETTQSRTAARAADWIAPVRHASPRDSFQLDARHGAAELSLRSASHTPFRDVEGLGMGWGIARAVSGLAQPDRTPPTSIRSMAIVVVFAALLAVATGYWAVAVALGVAAVWAGARLLGGLDGVRNDEATGDEPTDAKSGLQAPERASLVRR